MIEIAELANVSIATVSRILNQNGRYSKETEKKVMDIVEKYDYQINQSAKSLRTKRTNTIGIVIPDITNEFFAKIVREIEDYIVPKGYTVFVCDSNESEKMEEMHILSLVGKSVDGIVYISTKKEVHKIYDSFNIPAVYIDRRPHNAGTLIISDNEMGGYLATMHLIEKGCKKIVMLRDEKLFSTVKSRYAGYLNAHQMLSIPVDNNLCIDVKVGYAYAKDAVTDLIYKKICFDGIFANNDIMAIGAIQALKENKIKVGKDIKVVGFDNVSLTAFSYPSITTISQDAKKLAQRSVDELLKLIKHQSKGGDVIVIPVELIERESTQIN